MAKTLFLTLFMGLSFGFQLKLKEKAYVTQLVPVRDLLVNAHLLSLENQHKLALPYPPGWHYLKQEELKKLITTQTDLASSLFNTLTGKGIILYIRKESKVKQSYLVKSLKKAHFEKIELKNSKAVVFPTKYSRNAWIPKDTKVDLYWFNHGHELHLSGKTSKTYRVGNELNIKLLGSTELITLLPAHDELFYQ